MGRDNPLENYLLVSADNLKQKNDPSEIDSKIVSDSERRVVLPLNQTHTHKRQS